ncbi:MAG: hypothetical protein LUB59_03810 [Candidatus Gastranaerophilales bacterium]|nr:hypothetical protein [Candidatus Gastranaerophilales bacterium]
MEAEIYEQIIADYKNGTSFKEIGEKYQYDVKYLKNKLAQDGYYIPGKYLRFTEAEISLINQYYPDGDLDELFQKIPNHTPEAIILKAKKMETDSGEYSSLEKMKHLISGKPYTMDESTFNPDDGSFCAITQDGYKVLIRRTTLNKKKLPDFFNVKNPYTVDNIRHYTELNGIETELLSNSYFGQNEKLDWKCGRCGVHFTASWKQFLRGKRLCDACTKKATREKQQLDMDYVIKVLSECGYILKEYNEDVPISKQSIVLEDNEGYKYEAIWNHVLDGIKPHCFDPANKFTIENINHYLSRTGRSDYSCISEVYTGNHSPLAFVHKPCGTIFKSSLVAMQGKEIEGAEERRWKTCPNCFPRRIESLHASVLKQVFLHEYPDTVIEDQSCRNPNSGLPLPTDIVNHRLKIAVEIQSQYHDGERQAIKDAIKREFWLNKGYKFYGPDIRDYSVLGIVQVFFPSIKELPTYLNYNYSCSASTKIAEDLLNAGLTIGEVADAMDVKYSTIYDIVQSKRIVLPANYTRRPKNVKAIVQLDENGEYLNTFSSFLDIERNGYNRYSIRKKLKSGEHLSQGFYWIFEKDYKQGVVEI